jgi:hypothetical protein
MLPQYTTRAGSVAYTNWSGTAAAADVLIVSGQGRLNTVMANVQMQSGQQVTFYDSNVATSGGPFPASGHIFLGRIKPTWDGTTPGVLSGAVLAPVLVSEFPQQYDVPFSGGLCFHTTSGAPGFTVTYTSEFKRPV